MFDKRYDSRNFQNGYEFNNLYDNSLKLTLTKDINHFVEVFIKDPKSFKLNKMRILKLRNETEQLTISINFLDGKSPDEQFIDYKKGWNEIQFNNLTNFEKFKIIINQTTYSNLEIAELQVLGYYKKYTSCHEWILHSTRELIIIAHDIFSYEYFDAAKIESGSNCISSSGDCQAAFEDSFNYIDYLWKPYSTDQNIFIRVDFYEKYQIEEIFIKQPIENTINELLLLSNENLIVLNVNKAKELNNWKVRLNTKYLKFLIDKKENDTFHGFYYIQAFSYKYGSLKLYCQDYGLSIRGANTYIDRGQKTFTPKSTEKCSSEHRILPVLFVFLVFLIQANLFKFINFCIFFFLEMNHFRNR